MDGGVILDELASQLSSADSTLRARAYQTSLCKLKTLNLNTRRLELLFCKMEGASVADLIRDIQSDQVELASSAATFLSLRLRADSSTMKLETGREIIVSICDAISKTTERTVCEKLMSCFSAQSFTPEIIIDQLDKILVSLETGQCHKHFNSHTIELEAVVVITRLLEQVPTAMEAYVTRWAHLVYPLVIHKKSAIRNQANLAFKLGLGAIKGNASVAKQLLDDLKPDLVNAFIFLMKNQQEAYSLAVWSSYVEILGPLLHRGSSINCLLPIVEMGFKNSNLEVKICAYRAWQAIIDNFALCEEIISDSKRIKLILKVFLTCNVKSEGLAVEKFRVWWHFIRCLRGRCVPWFEQVVVPLLQFSLHGKYVVSSSEMKTSVIKKASPAIASPPGLNTSGVGLSFEELSQLSAAYRPLLQRGCEALVMILAKGCDHCVSENAFSSYTTDRLEDDVLGKGLQAAKHLPFLISCARNCFLSTVIQKDEEVSMLWLLIVNHVKSLLETSDVTLKQERQNALEALLDTLSVATEVEIFSAEQSLSLIDEVMTLPAKVLSSSSYHIGNTTEVMKGCPCLYIIELLFRSKTLERCAASKRFHNTLEHVILAGFHNSSGVLSFCHSACEMLTKSVLVMKHDDLDVSMNGIKPLEDDVNAMFIPVREQLKSGPVDKSLGPDESCFLSVWSSIASHLHDHIVKSNEVNQGNNLEHDFSCMHTLLMFPMHVIGNSVSQQSVKSVTKLWTSIYATFYRLSSMVQNAGPNVACEEFCERLLTLLQEKSQEDRVLFDFICQCTATIAASADMSGVYSGTSSFGLNSPSSPYQITCRRKNRVLGNLHSLTKLVEVLLNSSCHHVQTESLTPQSLLAVIQITEALFNKRLPASFLLSTLRLLTKPLARLYQLPPASHTKLLTIQTTSKLDQLWSIIGNCIQTCHAGAFDTDLLELLSPLIAVTFCHSRRVIKNQTLKFWNSTFGSSGKALSYPNNLRAVLSKIKDRSSIVLPGWQWDELTTTMADADQSAVDIELSQMEQPVPPIALKISPRKPLNSGSIAKAATPVQNVVKSTTPSRTPSARRASKNVKLSIFDDKSEDYVTIAPKSLSAKKVLTEHQKEVFQSRSILPAMYNNLDASVDISLTQFQSDSHADNTTSSGSQDPVVNAEYQDQQKVDTVEAASLTVEEKNMITNPVSTVDHSGTDPSASKAPDNGEDNHQNPDAEIVSERHESVSLPKQPLPDCRVRLVRLPDFLLSQNSNDSSESMVNKVTDADGGSMLKEGDSSSIKNLLETYNEALGEKSNVETAEKPTGNKMNMDLLICENTETEPSHTDVVGVSVVRDAEVVILVEDSQMPSCGSGQEDRQVASAYPTVESEMCIMETPEKADICEDATESMKSFQLPLRLFSDENQGLAGSPVRPIETGNIRLPSVDDFLMEMSDVTVVPDSCAIDSDHVTLCNKVATLHDTLLTVAMETATVADVQTEGAVAMETEEMSDSLLSCSSIFQGVDNVDCDISAGSMSLHISDVESIAEPDRLTPEVKPAVQVDSIPAEDGLSGPEPTEKRGSGEIGESTKGANSSSIEILEDLPDAIISVSDDEDDLMPLAVFMKKQPLSRGTRKQPMEGQRATTADQQIPAAEQQLTADVMQSEEKESSQIEKQVPTGVQESPKLSSQTQDVPSEQPCMSMSSLESEMQPSLMELPSAQPLQTQPKESEPHVSEIAELSPSVLTLTEQLPSEKWSSIADVISPEPSRFNMSTSSEDDVPLGLLVKKNSNVLSSSSQTHLEAYADVHLKVDADANSVLSLLGETQSKLVTKLRSRGRPKRSPYSSSSTTGLTLRSRSLVRADIDSLQMSTDDKSGQRKSRKLSLPASVENAEIQGKQIVGENKDEVANIEDAGVVDVTFDATKDNKEPKQCKGDETENKNKNEREVDKEKEDPEKHNCDRLTEMIEEKKLNETVQLIEDENKEKNGDAEKLNEMEGGQNKTGDGAKTQTEGGKEKQNDDAAAHKAAVSSSNYFTQICDSKSPSKKIQFVISDDGSDTPASGITAAETNDAVGNNIPDTKMSDEVRHSAEDASKQVAAAAVSKVDVTKAAAAAAASLISPAPTSSASPASLRKGRASEIPLTPTSSHRVLSRGHLMLSRSKQLFAMPNSGKLKTGTESPKSFFQSVAESARLRSQGSPFVLPSHVFSPSASPSAGILRKKRLREETPSVDSPSPPHKHRRVCFSDKVDTIEIPNRYQQRLRQVPVAKDSLSTPGKHINRQLEMTNTPLSSVSSAVISSKNQNLQKGSAGESSETKDSDPAKPDVILHELYSMDCEPSDNPQVLTMTPESQLNCSEPVFPELISCTVPVDHILPKLTTTTWMIGLRQLLHAKNIKTIGNLSSMSELEIHNLPIVQPKVDNLKESLQAFARSNKMSLMDDPTNKKSKLDPLATEHEGDLASLQDRVDGPSRDGCDVLRVSDVIETNSSDTIQVSSLVPEDDTDEAASIPASETDVIVGIAPAAQPLELSVSSETVSGEGNSEDHPEQLNNAPIMELEEPTSLVPKSEEEQVAKSEYEEFEDICSRLLRKGISREQAGHLLDLSLKVSCKCSQIVNSPSSSK